MARQRVPDDVDRILVGLNGHHDRAVALVGVALVEHFLERAIEARLKERLVGDEAKHLFSERGPGGSLENKIFMAYMLSIVGPKTRRDLDLLRRIRNEFAHNMNEIDFDTPEIRERIDQLHAVEQFYRNLRPKFTRRDWVINEFFTLVAGFQLSLEGAEANEITSA
jgi:DNA-binding MltR family transcriptional regulator